MLERAFSERVEALERAAVAEAAARTARSQQRDAEAAVKSAEASARDAAWELRDARDMIRELLSEREEGRVREAKLEALAHRAVDERDEL
eukprot:7266852-Prymnesium_polylepis.1